MNLKNAPRKPSFGAGSSMNNPYANLNRNYFERKKFIDQKNTSRSHGRNQDPRLFDPIES